MRLGGRGIIIKKENGGILAPEHLRKRWSTLPSVNVTWGGSKGVDEKGRTIVPGNMGGVIKRGYQASDRGVEEG